MARIIKKGHPRIGHLQNLAKIKKAVASCLRGASNHTNRINDRYMPSDRRATDKTLLSEGGSVARSNNPTLAQQKQPIRLTIVICLRGGAIMIDDYTCFRSLGIAYSSYQTRHASSIEGILLYTSERTASIGR